MITPLNDCAHAQMDRGGMGPGVHDMLGAENLHAADPLTLRFRRENLTRHEQRLRDLSEDDPGGTDPDLQLTVFWRDWSGEKTAACRRSRRSAAGARAGGSKAWRSDEEADLWKPVNHRDIRPGTLGNAERVTA